MTNRNNNSLNMMLAVQLIIAKFVAIWTGLLSFETTNGDFNAIVSAIKADYDLQKQILLGFANAKKEKKRSMATAASILCRKVRSFANATGDKTLAGKMKINFSMLFYRGSNKAIAFANNILAAAKAIPAADKTTYGISADEIAAMQTLIDEFSTMVSIPRSEIVGRADATRGVNAKFKEANRILIELLDNIMANFQLTNPDFYNQYKDARKIVDLQRHTVIEGNVTDENGIDLKRVKVTIVGKDKATNEEKVRFEELTNKDGNYEKQVINPEWGYDVTFELPTYQKVTKTDLDITRGEHEMIDVTLVKIV